MNKIRRKEFDYKGQLINYLNKVRQNNNIKNWCYYWEYNHELKKEYYVLQFEYK